MKPYLLIEMSCRSIARDDSIELQNAKAELPRPPDTVPYEQLADMPPSAFAADSIACVADMPAATDIVRVKDIQPRNISVIIAGNSCKALGRKEFISASAVQLILLRKCRTVPDDLIPDPYHLGQIALGILPDCH